MTIPACPISDNPAYVPGTYIAQRPEATPVPTACQMLARLCRRLGESTQPFDYRMEMARHRELCDLTARLSREQLLAQLAR